MSRVHVEYFAMLREQSGMNEETVETQARTPAQLYDQLVQRHGFDVDRTRLKVENNGQCREWYAEHRDDDEVEFLPPVAGG